MYFKTVILCFSCAFSFPLQRDSESCRQVSASIVVAVTQGLSGYVTTAAQLMQREVIDKLSVVAMEILLIALAHFEEELLEVSPLSIWFYLHNLDMSLAESQKGAINIQRCSIENQKGTITVQCLRR